MAKVFQTLLYALGSIIVVILLGAIIYVSYWRNSSTIKTFSTCVEEVDITFSKIQWKSGLLGEQRVDKIAFFVPVKVEGLKGNLFMQFDTGTPKTIFYGKTLNALTQKGQVINTFFDQDSIKYFKNPEITLSGNLLKSEKLKISTKLGSSKIDSTFINIGTIGFDAIVGRTLILDFKTDKLAITNKSAEFLDYDLNYIDDASVDKFPLFIPVKIGSTKTRLFYDTGSSMFSILTSNKKLQSISVGKIDTICCATHFGKPIPVFRKTLSTPITLGNITFDNKYIYSSKLLDRMDYAPNWFLFGMTGNKIFENKLIVIDNKNNKFGIKE